MDALLDRIRKITMDMGIVVFGTADTELWNSDPLVNIAVPIEKRPQSIMPGGKSVIVIGIPVQSSILDTAPSIYYSELYRVVNGMLDSAAQRIVLELGNLGNKAVFIPRDGYHGIIGLQKDPSSFFSHKHAAYLAGLGTFGVNNTILTKTNGPRIRFTSVITDAVLPSNGPMKEDLCIRCLRCTAVCPVNAIGDDVYPQSRIDKTACVGRSSELAKKGISPCGFCIRVCPVGTDRTAPPTDAAIKMIQSYIK